MGGLYLGQVHALAAHADLLRPLPGKEEGDRRLGHRPGLLQGPRLQKGPAGLALGLRLLAVGLVLLPFELLGVGGTGGRSTTTAWRRSRTGPWTTSPPTP